MEWKQIFTLNLLNIYCLIYTFYIIINHMSF